MPDFTTPLAEKKKRENIHSALPQCQKSWPGRQEWGTTVLLHKCDHDWTSSNPVFLVGWCLLAKLASFSLNIREGVAPQTLVLDSTRGKAWKQYKGARCVHWWRSECCPFVYSSNMCIMMNKGVLSFSFVNYNDEGQNAVQFFVVVCFLMKIECWFFVANCFCCFCRLEFWDCVIERLKIVVDIANTLRSPGTPSVSMVCVHVFCVNFPHTPPLKKITYAKNFPRNYFRGDCDGFA